MSTAKPMPEDPVGLIGQALAMGSDFPGPAEDVLLSWMMKLDPAVDPKILDIKSLVDKGPITKGTVIEAIYKLDGDTLTLVGYAGEEKKRPANFDPPKDDGVGMWVLKRVKE